MQAIAPYRGVRGQVVIFPKISFFTFRMAALCIMTFSAIVLAFYFGASVYFVVLTIFVCLILVALWALNRTLPRTKRYKQHISKFGLDCDNSEIDFDKAVSAAIPFESSRVVTLVYWHEKGIVFGRSASYRNILFTEIDEMNEIEFMGNPIVQLKLKGGDWEDNLFVPLDRTYRTI